MAVEVRVLGPVTLVRDGEVVALPEKQRRLLAALTVSAGRPVSDDRLVDAIWDEAPPATAGGLLQVYVSQLRKPLGAAAAVVRRGRGYALETVDDPVVDAERFERLSAAADAACSEGSPARAASLLNEALLLWHGSAYGEYSREEFVRAEAARLEELRVGVRERWLDARLQAGEDVAADALALVSGHPLRERPYRVAMLALYRAGRQPEALDLYRTLRSRLTEELGLEPSAEIRDLEARILRQDRSLSSLPSDARRWPQPPAAPNRLVGRERELAELRALLSDADVHLVTLTGAGGTGKTRVALEVARAAAPDFASGAAFVSLAAVRDSRLLGAAVADGLAIEHAAESEPLRAVAAVLQEEELLLVLDNVEQLRDATAGLAELVAAAPRITVLLTSRVVLHLSGEYVYAVDPLPLDDAVDLFHERLRAADRRTFLADEQREDVEEICRKLDALPLAIELAASRAAALTPSVLLRHLERRLELPGTGPRDLPARQQTLLATLQWSYGLLEAPEQALLRRLAVFAEPQTLATITAVCAGTPDLVASLVDHNLLVRITDGEPRFGMLETVREFAVERLEGSGEADELRSRHADYVISNLETTERANAVRPDAGEVRLALDWLAARSDPRLPQLAIKAGQHWHARGTLPEALTWLEGAVRTASDEDERAELLGLEASALVETGQLKRARVALAEARALARRTENAQLEAWLAAIGVEIAGLSGLQPATQLDECERAADVLRAAGDQTRLADVLVILGRHRFWCEQQPEDQEALEEALTVARESGNRAAELLALQWLAITYIDLRAPTDTAIIEQERLLTLAEGAPRSYAAILGALATLYGYAGRLDDARRTIKRSLETYKALGSSLEAAIVAVNAAWIELLAEDLVAAEEILRGGLNELASADERAGRATLTIYLADALHRRGQHAEAAAHANAARELELDPVGEALALAFEAKAQAHLGAIGNAKDLLQQADARAAAALTVAPIYRGELLLARGEVHHVSGDLTAAAADYRAAHALYSEKRAWPLVERAERLLGELEPTPA